METREKIIEVALEQFLVYGVRAVTMDEIAKQAGMSKKTIYEEFSSKEALVNASFDVALKEDECAFHELMEGEDGVIDHLLHMTRYLRERFSRMNPLLLQDIQRFYPKCWKKLEDFKREHAWKGIVQVLDQGKQSGDFRKEINSEILAYMRLEQITSLMAGNVILKKYSLLDFHLQALDHFIHGILTDQGRNTYYKKLQTQQS
ncbi:TetR/AcrR family transcriptional regulator [Cyclobacterium jeungdonense]|uniref:TetR/AcrR family transcriptional regulator n=1 Tax=Cyclobacterium jeungdonense TaxID=708087 RepID=A0ABT8C5K8_9BACT|nr:TetR/AcrR family transcriptional regulator [Cyclobacterium jeungdonense]MDN3687314.1 TetR/AcrR family transcriptional regulator [Cyclobacterium jeungdonense]